MPRRPAALTAYIWPARARTFPRPGRRPRSASLIFSLYTDDGKPARSRRSDRAAAKATAQAKADRADGRARWEKEKAAAEEKEDGEEEDDMDVDEDEDDDDDEDEDEDDEDEDDEDEDEDEDDDDNHEHKQEVGPCVARRRASDAGATSAPRRPQYQSLTQL